jgi:hypothetical protein
MDRRPHRSQAVDATCHTRVPSNGEGVGETPDPRCSADGYLSHFRHRETLGTPPHFYLPM